MTRDERNAYAKGYAAGSRGRWPAHRPPRPPEAELNAVIAAAQALRDAADGELAKLDEKDEWTGLFDPLIDAFDEAMIDLSKWMADKEPPP